MPSGFAQKDDQEVGESSAAGVSLHCGTPQDVASAPRRLPAAARFVELAPTHMVGAIRGNPPKEARSTYHGGCLS